MSVHASLTRVEDGALYFKWPSRGGCGRGPLPLTVQLQGVVLPRNEDGLGRAWWPEKSRQNDITMTPVT